MILFGKQAEYTAYNRILKNPEDTSAISKIVEIASAYGFCGNLWQVFLAWLIINDENPYTISREMKPSFEDSLSKIAMLDFEILKNSFFMKIEEDSILSMEFSSKVSGKSNNHKIGSLASNLAKELSGAESTEDFKKIADSFYSAYGVGSFGLCKAFHVENTEGLSLKSAEYFDSVRFSDLWGYDIQKKTLADNTERFLSGKQANNVLLYGDSGTGKSTAIKALLNEYENQGLRIVEIYKHQLDKLSFLTDLLKNRSYKFIIYMDDLSFEDFEIEYKYLKALIEGGLEPKPDNILIYATSNRRHLIKESHSDRNDSDEKHHSDNIQEKLSLAERFGISIYYPKPVSAEYKDIVLHLAKLYNVDMDADELLAKAHIWGMEHGHLSGRIARQFIADLVKERI